LIFFGQLVDAGQVVVGEADIEQCLGRLGRKTGVVRTDQPG